MENKGNTAKTGLEGSKQEPETETNNNCNNNSNNVVGTTTTTTTTNEEGEEQRQQQIESRSSTRSSTRTPFGELSQEDADLALARTLQEQERAYVMLRMNQDGIHYGSWDTTGYFLDEEEDNSDDHRDGTDGEDEDGEEEDEDEEEEDENEESEYEEEDAFDAHAESGEGNPPAVYSSDEAFARALQEVEEREIAARLMALAGINDGELEDTDDHDGDSQDTWDEVDPDELSYEELLALGEVVGTESRGLSADKIASLSSVSYKSGSIQSGSCDSCVICRLEYEDGDTLTVLSCKHSYHPDCINNWLKINKVCPVCNAEVSTSGNS